MECPVCRAENKENTACRRCKADLSLLQEIDRQREVTAATGWRHVGMAFAFDAADEAALTHECRAAADSYQLLAAAHLLKRDFAKAWHCYQMARQEFES